MEAAKEIFAVIGAIIGVLTGLLTLYAKYLDLKRRAARAEEDEPAPPVRRVRRAIESAKPDEYDESIEFDEPPPPRRRPRPEPADFARARRMVKGPAIALMAAGVLSLLFNVFIAGFGFVDEFVTPLSDQTKQRKAAEDARKGRPVAAGKGDKLVADKPVADESDRVAAVMAIVMLMGFSVASVGAAWAGYSMLHLRSYWLSVAGSFAVMPGACFCCLAGVPIGVWSLVVLLKPEVSAAFR